MNCKPQILPVILCLVLCSCSSGIKLRRLYKDRPSPALTTLEQKQTQAYPSLKTPPKDTLTVNGPDGRKIMIMRAVKDENGEMVATEELAPAIVVAPFRHVAERDGRVELRFRVCVPDTMLDSHWQLRLFPLLHLPDSTAALDPVIISGSRFRKEQLRGYQLYERFLSSIVGDNMHFVRKQDLEHFIERNSPELFALKYDSTLVSESLQVSVFGVSGAEAVEHYTNSIARMFNDRKIARKDRMFRKFVKSPWLEGTLRLDTVIRGNEKEVIFEYVQALQVRPKLKKAQISMNGGIYSSEGELWSMTGADSLTFYISSIGNLMQDRERYLVKVIERRVEENSVCWIEFESGKSVLEPARGNNPAEMSRIQKNLAQLLDNELFDIDSIVVTASASPEGSLALNGRLAQARSASVSAWFGAYVKRYRDSLARETGLMIGADGEFVRERNQVDIRFVPHSIAENWELLDRLVVECDEMPDSWKGAYREVCLNNPEPDSRERQLQSLGCYRFLREKLYPYLRTVRFDFCLHRRGMVKDTVHTTVPDTLYREGLKALKDRDYARAVSILRPYADYNTAVAYCAAGKNASAMQILKDLPEDGGVEYLKAVLYSRDGNDAAAVESFLKACSLNPSYIYRASLDPEISVLTDKYKIENSEKDYY